MKGRPILGKASVRPVVCDLHHNSTKVHVNSLLWENNGKTMEKSFSSSLLSTRSATAALSAPWHIDSKMKGSLSSSVILNAMTQDSVADSLDRCMLGDLCARPLAGPQEQILTVYFSKLKATGRQQFLYFWTLDKLNPARCKRT